VKKQPELPDLVRDMEIVQSLKRMTRGIQETPNDPEVSDGMDVTDNAPT
jgi:hypothetical protein